MAKFKLGDRVRLNPRTPENQSFTREEMLRPRTIVSIRYDKLKACCYYTLGNNGKGKHFSMTGNPVLGYLDYYFRSYMLIPYEPRKYGKRRYRMSVNDKRLQSKTT